MRAAAGFGARVKALRERAGESPTSFARKSGVARSYLYRVEDGEVANPRLDTIKRIASALGVSVPELMPHVAPAKVPVKEPALVVPPKLARFVREWESRNKSKMPKDTIWSLSTLQFHGRRLRTVDDYRVVYAVVDRILKS